MNMRVRAAVRYVCKDDTRETKKRPFVDADENVLFDDYLTL